MDDSARNPAPWRDSLMAAAGLTTLTLAAYSNSFSGEFIFDDQSSIVKNPSLDRLWPLWSPFVSPSAGGTRGRPFANLTFALNHWVGGMGVAGYHATNLAIHIAAGLALFAIMRRTFGRGALAERFGAASFPLAFVVAALWLVHPLLTEDVTYLSQRTESLMGLLYLLTLYCVIRGAESAVSGRHWYGIAVASCLLGMASKEIMITAPVVIFVYDRTFLAGSFREAWRRRWLLYLGLASGWILLGYLMAGIQTRGAGLGLGVGPVSYGLCECRAIVRYLCLSIWPHPLVFDYGTDLGLGGLSPVPFVAAILVLVVALVVMLRYRPAVGFALFWFLVILSPTSSIIPVALQPVAEHRMYLPLIAVISVTISAGFLLVGRFGAVLFAALALCLSWATWTRNEDYRTSILIWKDTVEKRPLNARAHSNLGSSLLRAGQIKAGMEQLDDALRISPDDADTNLDLGVAIAKTGDLADALARIRKALAANPGLAEGYFDLGYLDAQMGQIPEALEQYQHALLLNPDYYDAHCNLADLLLKSGRFVEAIPHYDAAIKDGAPDPELYFNLAFAEIKTGHLTEAIADYRRALELKPDFAQARHNLELLEGTTHKSGGGDIRP